MFGKQLAFCLLAVALIVAPTATRAQETNIPDLQQLFEQILSMQFDDQGIERMSEAFFRVDLAFLKREMTNHVSVHLLMYGATHSSGAIERKKELAEYLMDAFVTAMFADTTRQTAAQEVFASVKQCAECAKLLAKNEKSSDSLAQALTNNQLMDPESVKRVADAIVLYFIRQAPGYKFNDYSVENQQILEAHYELAFMRIQEMYSTHEEVYSEVFGDVGATFSLEPDELISQLTNDEQLRNSILAAIGEAGGFEQFLDKLATDPDFINKVFSTQLQDLDSVAKMLEETLTKNIEGLDEKQIEEIIERGMPEYGNADEYPYSGGQVNEVAQDSAPASASSLWIALGLIALLVVAAFAYRWYRRSRAQKDVEQVQLRYGSQTSDSSQL